MTHGDDTVLAHVMLTTKSEMAVVAASQATGDNWTDTMNRAVQVYAYLGRAVRQGRRVVRA